jgi:peroxiredoxin Q/BCP
VRDALPDLSAAGVAVLGISPDKVVEQKKFRDKYSLGFPLLSDGDTQIAKAYGVWGEKKMYGRTSMGIIRSAFLVDEAGNIAGAGYKISPKDTVPTLMRWLAGS